MEKPFLLLLLLFQSLICKSAAYYTTQSSEGNHIKRLEKTIEHLRYHTNWQLDNIEWKLNYKIKKYEQRFKRLEKKVSLLTTCMTTPQDASCSLKTTTTSVPYQVTNMDACFTSIDSGTCGASYGASSLLPSSEGTGLVGWTKQLKQPAVTQCTMDNTALTFPNTASGTSPDVSTVAGTPTPIVPGCDVARIYEKITFAKCSQTGQPNSATSYHLEPNKAKDEITINKEGVYKIEFTALMKSTDNKLMRAEVFKITSKDAAANCGSITAVCTTLLQMRTKTQLVEAADRTADKTDERTTNGEGVFTLCEGDRLLIIASKGGSQASNLGTISGDVDGIRTFLTVEKIGFTD